MLDKNIKEQLQSAFANLENKIDLVYQPSTHADQNSLLDLLTQVAETSDKISAVKANATDADIAPQFTLHKNGQPTGIFFKGIPGGHEFTSLILAILNADGKGKQPDQMLINRIKSLKGPINIRTFISLTCENCPDVVQALNLMSLHHPDFKHEMIDGAYTQDEITKLGIQGVPSVIVNDKLLHSGRSNFAELLKKLEDHYGVDENQSSQNSADLDLGVYDVVVIGGGPAGAAAAIYSVRKGLKTALIAERFGGQVQDTKGIENLISVVYTEGPQLAAQLNKHVTSYPVKLLEHRRVASIDKVEKIIKLESGEFIKAHSIIVATGAKWRELNIPGEKDYIGRGVAFCPHCDGPYYKGKKVAVIGGGNSGVEAAIDLSGIVSEVILFEYNQELKADKVLVDKLKSIPNVKIYTSAQTSQVNGDGQKVTSLDYIDRATNLKKQEVLDGVFVQIGLLPNSQFIKDVVETNKFGEIVVDNKGRTSVPGIYAAGDVTTTPFKQIIIAMGEGAKAALTAFEDRMYKDN
ncbi:MAG: alkyl hydroperoxide reductase subunit F [Pseudobdellovibrio sp.]